MDARTSAVTQCAAPAVHEGDVVLFFYSYANGFLYSDVPCSQYSHVSIQKVNPDYIRDPLPNLQFAAFQLQPIKATVPGRNSKKSFRRALVFGRKVKLFHIASKKYLSITPDDPTKKSDRSSVVVLKPEEPNSSSDISTWFRILPGKLDKHHGEDIIIGDMIKFQSLAKKGQHLYCSLNMLSAKYELKLGNIDSIFTLYAHTEFQEVTSSGVFKAGDPVVLFNVQYEAFVSVSGSFAVDTLPEELQNKSEKGSAVVARSRRSAQGSQKLLPTSGDTVWQIERFSEHFSGAQLQYEDKCRVKHMLTRKYLAVVHDEKRQQYDVTLQSFPSDRDDEDFFFTLTPIVKERKGELKRGYYVKLRHTKTDLVIGVKAENRQLKRTISLGVQNPSSSLIYTVAAMDPSNIEQTVFTIEEVYDSLIEDFYYATSVVSVFSCYMQEFQNDQIPVLDELIATLENLSEWLTGTQLSKRRVNLLRAAKIIDQMMGFLMLVKDPTKDDLLPKLCKQICEVTVKYLENFSYDSPVYLAEERFLSVLLDKVGRKMGVEDALEALIHDNTELAERIVTKLRTAERSAHDLLENLDVTILNFFSTLCFTGGKPVRSLQNSILEFVVEKGKEQLFRTKVQGDTVVFDFPERLDGKYLSTVAPVQGCDPKEGDLGFFLAQIKLFSSICKGGNAEAKTRIGEKYITFAEALVCLKDQKIHPKLQSYYLDFVMSVFVHPAVEVSGTDIENIWRSYKWMDITADLPHSKLVDFTEFQNEIEDLKLIIKGYLGKTKSLNPAEVGKNELILNMLKMVKLLVAYGFYCERSSVEKTIESLTCLIDTEHIIRDSDGNRVIFVVKTEAICILHLLFKQYTDEAVRKFIYNFKAVRYGKIEELSGSPGCKKDGLALAKLITSKGKPERFGDHVTKVCRRLIQSHFDESCYQAMDVLSTHDGLPSHSEKERPTLVEILIKVLQLPNDELRMTSARLLFDMHKRESILFSNALQSYLTTEASIHIHDYLVRLGSLADRDKLLLKMRTRKLNDRLKSKLKQKLQKISSSCLLDEDPAEPSANYQGITYSTRVFHHLLYFVLNHNTLMDACDGDFVKEACEVLINCTYKNPTVQVNVYDYLLELMNAKVAVYSFARLVTEVLTDNDSLCRKLSEEELSQMFQLAQSKESPDHSEYCSTLQAAIKVGKTSPVMIRSNQEFIAKLFQKYAVDDLLRVVQNPEEETGANDMLVMDFIDLLSVCTEKEGKSARRYARGLFSIDNLLKLMVNEDIPLAHRKPYAHLLTEAFINDKMESSCDLLAKERKFLGHIDYCAEQLTRISTVTENVGEVRIVLKMAATSHMSVRRWEKLIEEKFTADLSTPAMEDLGGMLLYLFEGIIPLVTAFCMEFDKLSHSGPARKTFKRLLKGKDIAMCLCNFAKSVGCIASNAPIFATSCAQVDLLMKCLRALFRCIEDVQQGNDTEKDMKGLLTAFRQQELVSSAKRDCDATFGSEQKLNKEFQMFVQNYQTAFEQNLSTKQKYFGAGVVLPQGPSFNSLVKHFSNIAKKGMSDLLRCITMTAIDGQEDFYHLDSADALITLLDILSRRMELRLSNQERRELDEMLLTSLQLFTALVEQHIASIDQDLQHTNRTMFIVNVKDHVSPVQGRLLNKKVHEKVMLHLDHGNDEITIHALAMLSVLLHFANRSAQEKINTLIRQDQTHIFGRMHKILTTASSILLEERPDAVQFKQLRALKKKWGQRTEEEMAAAEQLFIKGSMEHLSGARESGIPMQPICSPSLEEDTDTFQPLINQQEDTVITVEEDSKPSADDKKYSDSDEHEKKEDKLSDSWDDEDNYSDLDIDEESGEVNIMKTVTKLPEVRNVSVILDILAWICDGQKKEMQNLLREQSAQLNNYNIVGQVAVLLLGITNNLHCNPHMIVIAKRALQALIEMCAGNYLNQEVAFKGQVTDSIMKILLYREIEQSQIRVTKEESANDRISLVRTQTSAVELLEVLLEETSELSHELAHGISQDLDVSIIISLMKHLWKHQQEWDEEKKDHLREETRHAICRAFHVVCKMADNLDVDDWTELTSQSVDGSVEYQEPMWKHVTDWSHSIEVDYKPEDRKAVLSKVYFPFDPERHLDEASKEIVNSRIDRDSGPDKLTSLLNWIISIQNNVEYNKTIREKWYFKWALNLSSLRHLILIFLTLLMNLFIVILLRAPEELENGGSGSSDGNGTSNSSSSMEHVEFIFLPQAPDWFSDYVLYIGGSLHLFFSVWMVVEYFIRERCNVRFRLFTILVYKFRKSFIKYKKLQWLLTCFCAGLRPMLFGHFDDSLLNYERCILKERQPPEKLHAFEIDFISFSVLYRLIFVGCSIAALGTSGYFYCGCLLYIFMTNNVMLVILSAVYHSAAQLFSVFFLIFMILFIYAVISFVFLHNFFVTDEGLFCSTLGKCVLTVIRQGLLDTLGIDIPLAVSNIPPSLTILGWRVLFDISFVIIITILGLNIVVAILVDRFSEVREKKDKIREDQQGKCLICSHRSDKFDRYGKGFWEHVREDHNMWNYLYFVLYLDTIPENDHNALESYVYKHVKTKSIEFFPLHKAKVLSKIDQTKENEP